MTDKQLEEMRLLLAKAKMREAAGEVLPPPSFVIDGKRKTLGPCEAIVDGRTCGAPGKIWISTDLEPLREGSLCGEHRLDQLPETAKRPN